jgi:hypothetical protein
MKLIAALVLAASLPSSCLAAETKPSAVRRRLDDEGAPGPTPILTDLGDICSLLLGATLGATVPALAGTEDSLLTCGCDPTIIPSLSISFECESAEPVCIPDVICGTPSIEAGLDLTALLGGESPITFEACYSGTVIGGVIGLPDQILCFSFLQTLLGSIGIGPLANGNADDTRNSTSIQAESTPLRECTATLNDQECSSCSFCDNNQGLAFDCTNIEGGVVSNTCVAMKLPNDVQDVYRPDQMIAK